MKLETNGDYNSNQYNLTVNRSPDGTILSMSEMYNLRGETPKKVYRDFLELKKLIDGKEDKPEKKIKNIKKETQKTKKENEDKKEQKKDNPGICPKCGASLVEKSGISSKTLKPYHFYGCSSWPICNFTKPFISEAEKNAPCDEDLIEVPF